MVRTRLIFLIFLLISCWINALFAGNEPTGEELFIGNSISITAYPSSEKNANGEPISVIIPLKRVGRLFLIEAKIDNEVGNFVFDSGSSKLVLNRTYFRKYVMIGNNEGGGVTGNFGGVGQVKVRQLQILTLSYQNLIADVTDLGHIENRRGIKILGLFSLGLVKNMEIVVDLNKSELKLYRVDKSGKRLDDTEKPVDIDVKDRISEFHNVLFVKAKIGGKTLNFCLDTGAESNVINNGSPKAVMNSLTINKRSELTGSGSQGADVLYATMNDFSFAEKKFGNMQAIVTSLESMSEAYGMTIDGMLGYDFFAQGVVCINLPKKEIGIQFHKKERP